MSISRVSIHAPVKGATRLIAELYMTSEVSIHAPVKGATQLLSAINQVKKCFNPRAREGRDHPSDSSMFI